MNKIEIKNIINKMTLEEKASLCSGEGGWFTKGCERLNIPKIMMTDGPHGVRKVYPGKDGKNITVPATCYTTAAGLACSWNKELVERLGKTLANDAKAESVSVLLGPGTNMKRSPTCGRNFEYFSEDPYLAGKLSAAYIKGCEGNGVATSLKHFAANNQERRRHSADSRVDERTLREIYLTAFEIAVKEGHPGTVMHSYNVINGEQMTQCGRLMNGILRDEWGFDGLVMSDWRGMDRRVESLKAGCDLEMPSCDGMRDKQIVEAVKSGKLDEEVLNKAVERILNLTYKYLPKENKPETDLKKNHEFAAEICKECTVLLKNNGNVLPFSQKGSLAVIGRFAEQMRFQGGGSSHVSNDLVDNLLEILKTTNDGEVYYAPGYNLGENENTPDTALIKEAVDVARKADKVIVFAGMPDSFETEGLDRENMKMPDSHNELIEAVASAAPHAVVVLMGGSPVEMPWLGKVNGLLHAYLGGEAVGLALSSVIFGKTNPSGKLAETYPVQYEDNPAFLNYGYEVDYSEYAEGVFIGYRYYDKKKMKVNFPFGYGLSYTTFSYDEIKVDGNKVTVKITNTGKFDGKETVQLYVGQHHPRIPRPVKELKGFEKVFIKAGESKTVEFTLCDRSFAYYDVRVNDWRVDTDEYTVYVGASSANTPLTATVNKVDEKPFTPPVTRNTAVYDLFTTPGYDKKVIADLLLKICNEKDCEFIKNEGITTESTLFKRRPYYTLRQLVVYIPVYYGANATDEQMDIAIKEANEKMGLI